MIRLNIRLKFVQNFTLLKLIFQGEQGKGASSYATSKSANVRLLIIDCTLWSPNSNCSEFL